MRIASTLAVGSALFGLVACSACDDAALKPGASAASSSAAPASLSPELAAKPLATVGERVITLGEYAQTIDRMDQFERLRYQSTERRKHLLDEIVKVELLAGEARRRGLDKTPETQSRIRQILRDELLRTVRQELPATQDIPESEVREYYEKHKSEYKDPERRRVAHVVMQDKAAAAKVLEAARKASPMQWGKLVQDHSLDKPPKPSPTQPLELAGDLGIVSAPGADKGENVRVPAPLRTAVFRIEAVGGVHGELVEHEGRFHIVRMTGKTDARERSFAEAERGIRVTLVQQRLERLERELEQKLRAKFPVTIDEKALERVSLPALEDEGVPGPKSP